jgi:hypothetical protein
VEKMIESLTRWNSFRRNVNFWDWVKDTYSEKELRWLTSGATDCSLIETFNPLDNRLNLREFGPEVRRDTTKMLMKRYGDEIWSCCLGAGGYDPDSGRLGIQCLSRLDLAVQVHNQKTFEEFLVRNALKRAAEQIIEEHRTKNVSRNI